MILFRQIAIALALVLFGTGAFAQNSGLIRLTERDDLFGYEAVGKLQLDDGYCTGVLIAPDLVLTAAHCVMERDGTRRTGMVFRAGLRDGVAVAEVAAESSVVPPEYDPGDLTARRIVYDAALVKLETAIPAAFAAPFLVDTPSGPRGEVSVVSYARGRDDALSRQATCRLLGRQTGLMAFDCDVTFGASGAPVFERVGNRGRIVSLISSGMRLNGETVAYGMDLPVLVAQLKRQLASGEGVWPKPGFTSRRITVGTDSGGGAKFVRP